MVQSIEQYGDVLKVILKPTTKYPEGNNYFYCDNNEKTKWLINNYTWYLCRMSGTTDYVRAADGTNKILFHQAYANKLGVDAPTIDHINHLGIDNRDINLNVVDNKYNIRNKASNHNNYHYDNERNKFYVRVFDDNKSKYIGRYDNEFEAIKAANDAIDEYYSDYSYNFLLDRKNDLDILDDELTGKITSEEATFRHVMRYAKDNAWYVYRYGLEEYFNSRGIQIPTFVLDSQGYMIDTITKERLCPFK